MEKLHVQLVIPNEELLNGEYDQVSVPGVEGNFEVLPQHSPFITQLRPGTIMITNEGHHEIYCVHDGFVTVEDDKVLVLCESCEAKHDIDSERATASKQRAEKRIADVNNKDIDFRRAESSLRRAIARLNTLKAE